jgi:hypothetical protein
MVQGLFVSEISGVVEMLPRQGYRAGEKSRALTELSQLETIFGIFAIMFVGKSCVSIFEL